MYYIFVFQFITTKKFKVSNNQISIPRIQGNRGSFIKNKLIPFLKQGLLIPFIFASLLYILMRIFFIGSTFELNESIELYVKTFLVTWTYINAFRLICFGIIWLDTRSAKATLAKVMSIPVLKKTAILIIVAGLTYSVKAKTTDVSAKENKQDYKECDNACGDIDPKFYLLMK